MFSFGLLIAYLLAWKPNVGYITCGVAIIASYIHTSYNVIVHQAAGYILNRNPVPIKIAEFFDYVHCATTTYLPGKLIY